MSTVSEAIIKNIEAFVKGRFRGCVFKVMACDVGDYSKAVKAIDIVLIGGDFTPYVLDNNNPSYVPCYVRVCRSGVAWGYAKDLDYSVVAARNERVTLTKESVAVFKELVDFIKKNFSKVESVEFIFSIVGLDYYKDPKAGTISKPTKIDHKIFKGRKRRSVAESIIGGFFYVNKS